MIALYSSIPFRSVASSVVRYFLFCLIPLGLSQLIVWFMGVHVLVNLGCYILTFFILLIILKPVNEDQANYILKNFPALRPYLKFFSKQIGSGKGGQGFN